MGLDRPSAIGAESKRISRAICEAALAHRVGDAVEAAYRRGDALEKRRRLMAAWANFCSPRRQRRCHSNAGARPNLIERRL